MCGIAGFLGQKRDPEWRRLLNRMIGPMENRGPDDQGLWWNAEGGIGLGHRRLAIIDLSEAGWQPMRSESGRFRIVYNGEIYNFPVLRSTLHAAGHRFRGHSDTEVILASVERWGLRSALDRFIGMFAFALWDAQERKLTLVRDRLGIKPLFYGPIAGGFAFASGLRPMRELAGGHLPVDRGALALYLRHNYIPAPHSIHRGIKKLLPGHLLELTPDIDRSSPPTSEQYWSLSEVARKGQSSPFRGSSHQAVDFIEERLREAVSDRLVADVPVGAFLSGGIDSSTVVSLMQAENKGPVRTFAIGFEESHYNEAGFARSVAEHLGTDHQELCVTPAEARDVIPKLPRIYEEPFSDSSQIPTFLVSRLARSGVKVSLTGDGGDELFGGYNRYQATERLWQMIGWMPEPVRLGTAEILDTIPDRGWRAVRWFEPLLARFGRSGTLSAKVSNVSEVLRSSRPLDVYRTSISHWKRPSDVVLGTEEPANSQFQQAVQTPLDDLIHEMMYVDTLTYLPDDILVKVDRASMAVSLEARVPLLDHRVVEAAWSLPVELKVRHDQGKWLLRQVLHRHVPKPLVQRAKKGFGVPIPEWLRGPLRPWAEDLLSAERLGAEGYFRPEPIRRRWREHVEREGDWGYHLWDVLMFQSWLEENK